MSSIPCPATAGRKTLASCLSTQTNSPPKKTYRSAQHVREAATEEGQDQQERGREGVSLGRHGFEVGGCLVLDTRLGRDDPCAYVLRRVGKAKRKGYMSACADTPMQKTSFGSSCLYCRGLCVCLCTIDTAQRGARGASFPFAAICGSQPASVCFRKCGRVLLFPMPYAETDAPGAAHSLPCVAHAQFCLTTFPQITQSSTANAGQEQATSSSSSSHGRDQEQQEQQQQQDLSKPLSRPLPRCTHTDNDKR